MGEEESDRGESLLGKVGTWKICCLVVASARMEMDIIAFEMSLDGLEGGSSCWSDSSAGGCIRGWFMRVCGLESLLICFLLFFIASKVVAGLLVRLACASVVDLVVSESSGIGAGEVVVWEERRLWGHSNGVRFLC